ncbi:MAG: sigma-70 family RNA polymerase sigma factor [Fimbriimonas sp.]
MAQTKPQHDPEELVVRYVENPRPELKDLIMVQFAGLVERTARKFSGVEPYEDLVQVGFIGLLNALSKFDPMAGVRFNTYATYLVAGEIKHYLRDRAQTIRQPAWLQELRHKVNKTAGMLQQTLQRVPTDREIADEIGVSESAVQEVFQTQELLRVASLDQPAGMEEDGMTEIDRLDAGEFCPEQLSVEDRLLLEAAMKQLRDLERKVLVLFHFESKSQTEIAAELSISCNYVSHILRQSLAKLRRILSNEEEKDRLLRRQSASLEFDVVDRATGAYTELFFRNRLEEELHRASANESGVALILIKFDGLEAMGRFYGEQSVTDFLADAAEFFRENLRRLDVVARYGETGFGILLPLTATNVDLVRERLLKRISDWTAHRLGPNGSIRVELGQASAPHDGRSSSQLIKAAIMVPADRVELSAAA